MAYTEIGGPIQLLEIFKFKKNFSIVDTRVTLILDVQHGDSSSVCYAVPTSVANHLSADYAITISLTVFSMLCLLFL